MGCLLLLVFIHLSLTLPLISNQQAGYDNDEQKYYVPSVLQIRSHWPKMDLLGDSLAATPPLYPYFLATVSFLTGPDLIVLRLVNDMVGLAVLVMLFLWLGRYLPLDQAFVLTLPLALNNFFLKSSFRVFSDNAALVLVTASLACVFLLPASGFRGAAAGIFSTLAVGTRQLNLWLVVPELLQSFWSAFYEETSASSGRRSSWWKTYGLGFASRLLPLGLLAVLIYSWHGLVPPQWQEAAVRISLAPVSYLLAVAGLTGPFFLLALGPLVPSALFRDRWVIGAIVLGFFITLISPNTYDASTGRWGGYLWPVVQHLPALGERSAFFMLISPIGAGTITLFVRLLWISGQRKEALLWGCSVLAWMMTFAVNRQVFHRYYEPMLLVFFAIGCALLAQKATDFKLRFWPVWLLIGFEAAVSYYFIYSKLLPFST